jgi:hypothetical protein
MGACSFGTIQVGKFKNQVDAYRVACGEAIDCYGNQDGYNGTISTTHGTILRTDSPRFDTKAFWKWEDKRMEKLDKCDCECVEIKGAKLTALKKERGFSGKRGIKAYYFYGIARE